MMEYRTENLILRSVTEADLSEVARSWPSDHRPLSEAQAQAVIDRIRRDHTRNTAGCVYHFCLAVCKADDPRTILGWCGLDGRKNHQEPEIFILLDEGNRNKGFGTQCVKELLRIAVDEFSLPSVHGGCSKENHASQRAMEKGGMIHYGEEENGDPLYRFWAAQLETNVPVYQPSSKAFWDDAYISQSMLKAHLDFEHDGASRKLTTIQRSVEWICRLFPDPKGKRLLDLGCGPGLYSERLYDKGFSVTGVDFSRRSVAYAKDRAQKTGRNIDYHYQNYLDIEYENEFDIAVLIYCDFGVLPPRDRAALLGKIHKALKDNGIFILDVCNAPFLDQFEEGERIKYEQDGFWAAGSYAVIQRNTYYKDTNNTLERYLILTEDACDRFNIWNQVYSAETFTKEITEAGFTLLGLYDDVCGKNFTGEETTLCGVFQK